MMRCALRGAPDPTKNSWGDLLTSYNGNAITYDSIGNPLTYHDGTTFTWEGRRLVSATKNGTTYTYTYNDEGLRTSKTVGGVTTEYFWDGTRLILEKNENEIIHYLYDSQGAPFGMQYCDMTVESPTWESYWFTRSLQGDIVGVYNHDGTKLISYSYNAWGETSTTYSNGGASTSAVKNSLRYRGYYFDTDLVLYYLQSRYYDARTCRFINADGYVSTGQGILGYNMFAYCGNNPVNCIDSTGEAWWHWAIGATIVIGCAVAVVATAGGAAAGIVAVASVANGVAAATTASTVAAGAFIGASVAYGSAVLIAASSSDSIDDFSEQGDWGTVNATVLGGMLGGLNGYDVARAQLSQIPANPGKDFQPNGPTIQEGVNPNTLTPSKNLSTLSPQRIQSAVKYGGNQAIEVTRMGVILDGHHRVAYAIKHGQMVDVIVQVFK